MGQGDWRLSDLEGDCVKGPGPVSGGGAWSGKAGCFQNSILVLMELVV